VTLSALQGALEALYGLERRRDKLGLDGTRELLTALGNPERGFRAVHVAGTNGKGSVCARVERVLRASGVHTGLFTSPHLVDFRERIRVDGRWADETWLLATLERIGASPAGRDRTFFEVATALGFGWFAEQRVDWAVVEVGLGGRLDTTNVLTPAVSVITSIGLDHTEILGDTIESIAAEKAGIVKPGVPVVMGAGMEPRAAEVISAVARERAAPLVTVSDTPLVSDAAFAAWLERFEAPWGAVTPSPGDAAFGPANTATALVTLAVLARGGVAIGAEAVGAGLAAARWPGRFERCPSHPRLVWDGAHNVPGVAALARSWSRAGLAPPVAIVLAVSRDKDVSGMLAPLAALAGAGTTLIATRSRNERGLDPVALAAAARGAGFDTRVASSVAEACEHALALPGDSPVLLTGSLFAIGEAMAVFGGAPGERM